MEKFKNMSQEIKLTIKVGFFNVFFKYIFKNNLKGYRHIKYARYFEMFNAYSILNFTVKYEIRSQLVKNFKFTHIVTFPARSPGVTEDIVYKLKSKFFYFHYNELGKWSFHTTDI